jgi:hypothetical protein
VTLLGLLGCAFGEATKVSALVALALLTRLNSLGLNSEIVLFFARIIVAIVPTDIGDWYYI